MPRTRGRGDLQRGHDLAHVGVRRRRDVAYDFSRLRTLVDVGGGQGALISSILRANPGLRGILFDIPPSSMARRLASWPGAR